MSNNAHSRQRRLIVWGPLLLIAVLVSYPLGVGPWLYVGSEIPLVQRTGSMYLPLFGALNSPAFRQSSIGSVYAGYVSWWWDLTYGDGAWDSIYAPPAV